MAQQAAPYERTVRNYGFTIEAVSFSFTVLLSFFPGKILTDLSRPNGPTFVGISGDFYPALSLYGTSVKLTVHTEEEFSA